MRSLNRYGKKSDVDEIKAGDPLQRIADSLESIAETLGNIDARMMSEDGTGMADLLQDLVRATYDVG